MKLSVVITIYNSQNFLEECLKSVKFADEIVIVNNGSIDQSSEIAKRYGCVIYDHPNNPKQLNESKNFGFTKASHKWILSLDSDERVEKDLKKEIEYIISQNDIPFNGYKIPRHNIIFGKVIKHGLWYPDYQLRLFKKDRGKFPNLHNHELLQIEGEAGVLKGHIKHLNYQTISQYIQKIDKQYSENEAETFIKNGGKIYWYDAIRFPFQDFLTNYFLRQAYKDGLHGLMLSLLQAFYMLIVFAKIWELEGFKKEKISLDQTSVEFSRAWRQILFWYAHESTSLLQKIRFRAMAGMMRFWNVVHRLLSLL